MESPDGYLPNLVGIKYSRPHTIVIDFLVNSAQGWIQGVAKIGHGGPLLQRTSSSDQKATATNRMHSSDLEELREKC